MRWGRPESIAEAGNNLAAALDVSHPAVAKKLRSLTTNGRTTNVNLAAKVEGLVHFESAAHGIETVILPTRVEAECQAILTSSPT